MPKTFNVDVHLVQVRGIRATAPDRQLEAARKFYNQFTITTNFKIASMPRQIEIGHRDVGPFDWNQMATWCLRSNKGCDLLVVPKMESIEGQPPFGLTILPGIAPPPGVPTPGIGGRPEPDPARPAIIFNAGRESETTQTVLHELGHALLNSLKHHTKTGNFMHADPPQQGSDVEALQIARLYDSRWLE